MYFVKYQPLKRKLKKRTLSDREAVVYLLVYSFLLVVTGAIPVGATDESNEVPSAASWDFAVMSLVYGGISIAGVYYVYGENGGKRGFDLIQKCFVLGWVVFVRCLIVFLPLSMICLFGSSLFFGNGWEDRSRYWPQYFLTALLFVVYFQRLGRHIRDTRNTAIESAGQEG